MKRLYNGEWDDVQQAEQDAATSTVDINSGSVDDDSDTDSLQPFDDHDVFVDEDDATDPLNKPIPPPRFLHDCIEYLREKGDNDTSRPYRVQLCLQHAERLIREHSGVSSLRQQDLESLCAELARRLLCLNNNYSLKRFRELRFAALQALVVVLPVGHKLCSCYYL
jgi:hypothetical protein